MKAEATMKLQVAEAKMLNPLIRLVRLRTMGGAPLPGYTAGAHIGVHVQLPDGSSDWRQYSLINFAPRPDATERPLEYVIAIRREATGRGGSKFMHEQLQLGASIEVTQPRNEFPLRHLESTAVLVAGGIGVTPLVSMAAARIAERKPVRMVYAGRRADQMAFVGDLRELLGEYLHVHEDEKAGSPLDLEGLLDSCGAHDQRYVCGPKAMLDAVLAKTQVRGWTRERAQFEVFNAATTSNEDRAFEIVLAQTDKTLTVAADKTILQCLIENGLDPLYDCVRGECGVCAVTVIEGEIDHRDYVLSDREKAAGNIIQTCISRCRGRRLVLDL